MDWPRSNLAILVARAGDRPPETLHRLNHSKFIRNIFRNEVGSVQR